MPLKSRIHVCVTGCGPLLAAWQATQSVPRTLLSKTGHWRSAQVRTTAVETARVPAHPAAGLRVVVTRTRILQAGFGIEVSADVEIAAAQARIGLGGIAKAVVGDLVLDGGAVIDDRADGAFVRAVVAKATMPIRRCRLLPLAKRLAYHWLKALVGWWCSQHQAISTAMVRKRRLPALLMPCS